MWKWKGNKVSRRLAVTYSKLCCEVNNALTHVQLQQETRGSAQPIGTEYRQNQDMS